MGNSLHQMELLDLNIFFQSSSEYFDMILSKFFMKRG